MYGSDTGYGDGLVPAGASDGSGTGFLREDGTWAAPTGTTYSTFTSTSSGLVPAAGEGASTNKYLTQAGSFVAPDTYGSGNSYAGGLMLAGTSDGSGRDFLREDGTWATPTGTTYSAGTNVSIDSATNEISATDTTYTAGTNVSISATNEITATDTTYSTFTTSSAGLVPASVNSSTSKFLSQAGTFVAPDLSTTLEDYVTSTSLSTSLGSYVLDSDLPANLPDFNTALSNASIGQLPMVLDSTGSKKLHYVSLPANVPPFEEYIDSATDGQFLMVSEDSNNNKTVAFESVSIPTDYV